MPGGAGAPPPKEEEVRITFELQGGKVKRSIPIWFTLYDGKLELLPMYGTRSKWFGAVGKSKEVNLKVAGWSMTAVPRVITDLATVERIKKRFAEKYGAGQVKKYYPTCDAAFEVTL